jgi:hypothetical protein
MNLKIKFTFSLIKKLGKRLETYIYGKVHIYRAYNHDVKMLLPFIREQKNSGKLKHSNLNFILSIQISIKCFLKNSVRWVVCVGLYP